MTSQTIVPTPPIPEKELVKLDILLATWRNSNDRSTWKTSKGNLTKLINRWSEKYGDEPTREILLQRAEKLEAEGESYLSAFIKRRLTPGRPYTEGTQVKGWWYENQLQACALPLSEGVKIIYESDPDFIPAILPGDFPRIQRYDCLSINFYGFHADREVWEQRGFWEAEHLPIVHYPGQGEQVDLWYVERTMPELGYYKAWTWWIPDEDGQTPEQWWREKKPELFELYDELEQKLLLERELMAGAAVLGGQEVMPLPGSMVLSPKSMATLKQEEGVVVDRNLDQARIKKLR